MVRRRKRTKKDWIIFWLGAIALAILIFNNLNQGILFLGNSLDTPTINVILLMSFIFSGLYYALAKI